MDRLCAAALRDIKDAGDVQVRLGCWSWTDGVSLIGFEHMQRGTIHLGVNCDGSDPEFVTGAGETNGDLPTVCDEYLLEESAHGASARLYGSPGLFRRNFVL